MSVNRRHVVIIVITLGVILIGYRLFSHRRAGGPTGREQPIPVNVATAVRKNVPIYLDALGTIQAYRTVVVQPMISGPLVSVEFHEGQDVRKGQLLAKIDPRPYRAALDQTLAKQAQDEVTLAEARVNLKRYQMLIAQKYASAQQVSDQAATVSEDAALVKQDQAAVETARTNLSYTQIRAPISGRTGILQVNAGNIVTPSLSTGIVVINTLRPIYVSFSLPQQDLSAVQKAISSGSPDVIAVNRHGAPIDRGVLAVLDNQVNSSTGTLTMRARFPNPDFALWPGAFVDIKLMARTDKNVITVPAVAVRQGPNGSFVYLVASGPSTRTPSAIAPKGAAPAPGEEHVVVRAVHVAYSNQSIAEIDTGLAAGDRVVTEGGSRLRDGSLIRIEQNPKPATGRSAAHAPDKAARLRRRS
ncbi:MAG: efflux RND transporter periplasmic adaptor subunit [Acidiferrobacterales bacterium]